jgi:hypothetical protein
MDKRVFRVFVIILIALIVIPLGIRVGLRIYSSNSYEKDQDVISSIENDLEPLVEQYSDESGSVFIPENQSPKAVIAFYPGGRVEYSAYSGLMYKLAARGYICILAKMPDNLAFLNIKALDRMSEARPEDYEKARDIDWYLAGHSLGGVAASKYLMQKDAYEFKGLIMCASYTTDDLSDSDIRLLSIYGDRDGVLNMNNYERSKELWPEDSTEVVIKGGIHSYFGSYGIQEGDGEPLITDEEQIDQTVDIIDDWISK